MRLDTFINETKQSNVTFHNMYHGGKVDLNKPIYFTNELIASTYGDVSGPYTITLKKPLKVDFSDMDGWWLSGEGLETFLKKINTNLNYFNNYSAKLGLGKDHIEKIKAIKTDHIIMYAKDKGYDGVVFKNIMDSGSLPIKGNKWVRNTNIVVIDPKKTIK